MASAGSSSLTHIWSATAACVRPPLALTDGGVEDVLALFEVAAWEAELAAGIDVPCSARQEDPTGAAQDDVDIGDPPGVLEDQAGEGIPSGADQVEAESWRLWRLAGRPRPAAMARIVSPYPAFGQASCRASRVTVVVLPDPIGPVMATTAGWTGVIAACPEGRAG